MILKALGVREASAKKLRDYLSKDPVLFINTICPKARWRHILQRVRFQRVEYRSIVRLGNSLQLFRCLANRRQ